MESVKLPDGSADSNRVNAENGLARKAARKASGNNPETRTPNGRHWGRDK